MENSNPFQLISSEKKYENPWISVREDKVIRPGGKEWLFGVVTVKNGSLILPVDWEHNVFLNYEYHYALWKYAYKLFGGKIDDTEDAFATAKRELSEESGIIADKWSFIGIVHPYTNVVYGVEHIYLAEWLTFLNAHPEEWEIIKLQKFTFIEALQMVYDWKITHGASVVWILRTKDILGL